MVEAAILKNLADLTARVGKAQRGLEAKVQEGAEVEIKSSPLSKDHILITLLNKLSEAKIAQESQHTPQIDHQNLEERNHMAQCDHL